MARLSLALVEFRGAFSKRFCGPPSRPSQAEVRTSARFKPNSVSDDEPLCTHARAHRFPVWQVFLR